SLKLPARHDIPALRGNNASRHRTHLPERAADGQNPVAHLHTVRVAQLGGRHPAVHIDLDHGQVGLLIFTNHLGVVLHTWRIILQSHANAIRLIHYVPVGNDVSLGIDNHPGTERTLANRRVTVRPTCPPKNRLKKSSMPPLPPPPLSSSSGFCSPRRRCGFLMVDSVLMLTTLGPNCLAIWENSLESCLGEGMVSGVASEAFCPSLPFTP